MNESGEIIRHMSVVIIAGNAQATIKECLDRLNRFQDVVLYINNSSDDTENIARAYANVNIVAGEFMGYGPTKNRAAQHAKNNWIFSLDSDELVPDELVSEVHNLDMSDERVVCLVKRDNYFLDKKIRFSGWGNDFLVRVYNRKHTAFNDNQVHEKVLTHPSTKTITLKTPFKHLAVTHINQFLEKIIKYSDLASENKTTRFFPAVFLRAMFAFFQCYVLKLGFLDGWRGVVISVSDANGRFYRYAKRYINAKQQNE